MVRQPNILQMRKCDKVRQVLQPESFVLGCNLPLPDGSSAPATSSIPFPCSFQPPAVWFMGCSWDETLQVAEPWTAGEQHASKHATMSQIQLVQRRGVFSAETSHCHCHTEKFRHKTIHSYQKISIGSSTLPSHRIGSASNIPSSIANRTFVKPVRCTAHAHFSIVPVGCKDQCVISTHIADLSCSGWVAGGRRILNEHRHDNREQNSKSKVAGPTPALIGRKRSKCRILSNQVLYHVKNTKSCSDRIPSSYAGSSLHNPIVTVTPKCKQAVLFSVVLKCSILEFAGPTFRAQGCNISSKLPYCLTACDRLRFQSSNRRYSTSSLVRSFL